jgi:hypothetical protein
VNPSLGRATRRWYKRGDCCTPPVPASSSSRSSRSRTSSHSAGRSAPSPQRARADASNETAPVLAVFSTDGQLLSLANERQELLCSVIGLAVKLGLVAVATCSLIRLAGAYQERMERQGEIAAVLELEVAKLAKARERFDNLFRIEGEQRLIREQSQWIAPNRMRIVWQNGQAFPSVETASAEGGSKPTRP